MIEDDCLAHQYGGGLFACSWNNMATRRSCLQDASFGPASTCRHLDFTIYFQQTYVQTHTLAPAILMRPLDRNLSFAPDVAFNMLAAVRLVALSRKKRVLDSPGWPLVLVKLASVLLTVSSTAANISYMRATEAQGLIPLWLPSPILQLLSSVSNNVRFPSTISTELLRGRSL